MDFVAISRSKKVHDLSPSGHTRSKTKKKKKVDANRYDNRSDVACDAPAAGSPSADVTLQPYFIGSFC